MGFDKKLASLFSKKKNRKKKNNNSSRSSSKRSIDNSSSQLGGGGDTIIESIQTFDCDDAEPCCSKYLTENELANQHTEKNNKQTRTSSPLFTRNGLRRKIDFNEPLQPLEFSDDENDGLDMTTSIEELSTDSSQGTLSSLTQLKDNEYKSSEGDNNENEDEDEDDEGNGSNDRCNQNESKTNERRSLISKMKMKLISRKEEKKMERNRLLNEKLEKELRALNELRKERKSLEKRLKEKRRMEEQERYKQTLKSQSRISKKENESDTSSSGQQNQIDKSENLNKVEKHTRKEQITRAKPASQTTNHGERTVVASDRRRTKEDQRKENRKRPLSKKKQDKRAKNGDESESTESYDSDGRPKSRKNQVEASSPGSRRSLINLPALPPDMLDYLSDEINLTRIYTIPRWRLPQYSPTINVVQSLLTEDSSTNEISVEESAPPPPYVERKRTPPPPRTPRTPPPPPPPITPGLPSSETSSHIDFSKYTPNSNACKNKIYGFSISGCPVEENYLPDIGYCFLPVKATGKERMKLLEQYRMEAAEKERIKAAKIFSEQFPPQNPDNVPKKERETAEHFIKNVYSGKMKNSDEESEDGKKNTMKKFRIRRRISVGSYPNESVDEKNLPRLLRYAWKGKIKKLEKYLSDKDKHRKINRCDEKGRTALHFAASWGCSKTLNILLKVPGVKLNLRDEDGKTPLFKAVEICSKKSVEILIEEGANASIASRDSRNAFEYALQELGDNKVDMIKYLYDKGGMRAERKEKGKMSFIHVLTLAKKGVPISKTMKELLNTENVNATEGNGRTALILATRVKRLDAVKCLVEHYADPMHLDLTQTRAIGYAERNSEIYNVLKKAMNNANDRRNQTTSQKP